MGKPVSDCCGTIISPPGPQGPTGPAGPTGATGPTGPTGSIPTDPVFNSVSTDSYLDANGDAVLTEITGQLFVGGSAAADTILIDAVTSVHININGSIPAIAADANGVGFNNSAPIMKPAIVGSRGGNVALANLLTQLALYGLIIDGTSP